MSISLRKVKLVEIAELNPRLSESPDGDEVVSFIPMSAVTAESASTTTGEDRPYADVSKGYTPFLNGDVLLAKITPCFENGKIAQAKLSRRIGFGSTEFHVVRPRAGKADARYLMHFLRQEHIRLDGARKMTGSAGQRRVPDHFLAGLEVSAPPVAEQRRIAEVLDRAESLRAKRRAALAQLDTLTQSIFLDLFGDPATNPKGWPVRQLGELGAGAGAIVDGPFGSAINVKEDYVDNGEIPVIRTKNVRPFEFLTDDLKRITRAKFKGLERSSVIPGDIILTKVGTIGNVCFFPPSFEIAVLSTTGSCRIRPDENLVRKIYLAYFLHLYRGEMMKLVAEGVQPFLNMSHIKSFRVFLPELKLQDEFGRRFATVERFKTSQTASLRELGALFAVLQHRAFRGEL